MFFLKCLVVGFFFHLNDACVLVCLLHILCVDKKRTENKTRRPFDVNDEELLIFGGQPDFV